MIALVLCLLALATTHWAGKRSLGQGLVALLAWGYFYGILRANLLTTLMYFVFDAALLGFYLSQKKLFTGADKQSAVLQTWVWLLMSWPVLMLVTPFQPILVALVGLRGSVLYLPMMLAGSRLRDIDLRKLSLGFAVLNLIACVFGLAEYFLGLQRFFPVNAATVLIYGSTDVAGGFFRIPATFTTAHLYGGTMAATVPYLIAGWEYAETRRKRWFILGGIAAALLGVLLSATRTNFVICAGLILVTILNGRMAAKKRVGVAVLILLMGVVAMRNVRLQRFTSLSDTDYVQDRISGSVNRSFFEILLEYPMGNGLGGGGTNMPEFLRGQVRNPIGMENEYTRILCEQGVIGLLLWLGFLAWFLSRFKSAFAKGPWVTCRRLVWSLSVLGLGMGTLGMGMLTAMPQTPILLLGIGWTATRMRDEARAAHPAGIPAQFQPRRLRPVPSLETQS